MQVAVSVRHQLIGLFRRGIEADRMIDIILHRERQFGIGAVDRGRRRKQQMLAAVVAAPFQHVDEALDVGVDVGVGVFERIANARLRRKMDDQREPVLCEQRGDCRAIGKIGVDETEPRIFAQDVEPGPLQRRIIVIIETVQTNDIAAFRQQPAGDVKADKAGRTGDQYSLIRHRILNGIGARPRTGLASLYPPYRGCRNTRLGGYCQIGFKTIPRRRVSAQCLKVALFLTFFSNRASAGEMRRILLSTAKILISAALLYLALRKANLSDLATRFDITSLGWIGLAIAVTFLQIFVGALRWREISAECGAPLATRQAMRFNLIGSFFNQTLPSAIGGDAVRLWLVARGGAGWRAAT
jgi:hypothetical protein